MKKTAAVITISDKGASGERLDTSGPAICQILEEQEYRVVFSSIIPDDKHTIQEILIKCADEFKVPLILTTGGTGFSPRDITPEATLAVIEREVPGIPEAMRIASLKITPKGCLSRSVAGIRGTSLIVNLPGSKKAAKENLEAVLEPIEHGLEMILSQGSANCAEMNDINNSIPSMDKWIKEAKKSSNADKIGMLLTHTGVVRKTAKALVREGDCKAKDVAGMLFSYDKDKVEQVIASTKQLEGIYYVRIWLNEGELKVGDEIMFVLIGGDIRPHVTNAMDYLLQRIKKECVMEKEIFEISEP